MTACVLNTGLLLQAMGYSSPPLTLGLRKKMRSNANVEWTVSDALLAPIFERCRDHLPQRVASGDLCGVNGTHISHLASLCPTGGLSELSHGGPSTTLPAPPGRDMSTDGHASNVVRPHSPMAAVSVQPA